MSFAVIFASVLLFGCTYVSLRLITRTSLSGFKKYLAFALCYSPLINVVARQEVRTLASLGASVPNWLDVSLFISYILIGTLSITATVIAISDLTLLAKKIYTWCTKTKQRDNKSNIKPDISRRIFMQNSLSAGLVMASGGFVIYGATEAMGMPAVKHINVPVKNLPAQFDGFSIAQLTDLHINRPIPITRLEKIVETVNALQPDCIVITGDLSDSRPYQVRVEMDPLRHLKAKHGSFFVSGNHEYYTGIESWLDEVARLELTNLHNEHHVIERQGRRLLMCGVPDIKAPHMSTHISSPILAQKGSQTDDIKVLLAHQPQNIYEAVTVGYDLQISGHTHGGQFFPWTYVTDLVQPYIHGLYEVKNTQLYVSRGTGYWGPPLRIGAPSEIAVLKLVAAT